MIDEPAVTLTDYALAIESIIFAHVCWRHAAHRRRHYVAFFLTLAVASIAGGTSHGFFVDESTVGYRIIWLVTLLAIGCSALVMWMLAARLSLEVRYWPLADAVAIVITLVYALTVTVGRPQFILAIMFYVPAALALLGSFARAWHRTADHRWGFGVSGMVGTFVAAGAQSLNFNLAILDHNTLYHLIQAAALFGILISCFAASEPANAVQP